MVDSLVKTLSEKMANQADDLLKQALEYYEPDLIDPDSKNCTGNDVVSLSISEEPSYEIQYKENRICNDKMLKTKTNTNINMNKFRDTSKYKEKSTTTSATTIKNRCNRKQEEELKEKVVQIYSHMTAKQILKCCKSIRT